MKISVLGAGMFGFPIANYLAEKENEVLIYDVDKELISYMQENKKHKYHFTKVNANEHLKPTSDFNEIKDSELIILSVPSKFIKEVVLKIKELNLENIKILNLSKGLVEGKVISEIIEENIDGKVATLTGGMIAKEFVNKKPLFGTIASKDLEFVKELKTLFSSNFLCFLGTDDIKGAELAGPLKNVIAIFAGMAQGLGYEASTIGGFITAFSYEVERLAEELGCNKETFSTSSPAWAGDVMATCFGNSRNREFGERIAKSSPEKVIEEMKTENKLVEGYETTRIFYELSKKLKVDMPMISQIYEVLYENKDPHEVLHSSICRINNI